MIIGFKIIYETDQQTYKNDPESIIEVITSYDLFDGKTIEILEIYDYDDSRIITFLSDSSPSIIEFYKDKKGNYISKTAETRQDENLSPFLIGHIGNDDEVILFSVKNQYADIDEFSFKANENTYTVKFDSKHPYSQATILGISGNYQFEWFYHEE